MVDVFLGLFRSCHPITFQLIEVCPFRSAMLQRHTWRAQHGRVLSYFRHRIGLILMRPFGDGQQFLLLLWRQIWIVMAFGTAGAAKRTNSTYSTVPTAWSNNEYIRLLVMIYWFASIRIRWRQTYRSALFAGQCSRCDSPDRIDRKTAISPYCLRAGILCNICNRCIAMHIRWRVSPCAAPSQCNLDELKWSATENWLDIHLWFDDVVLCCW